MEDKDVARQGEDGESYHMGLTKSEILLKIIILPSPLLIIFTLRMNMNRVFGINKLKYFNQL